MAKDKENISKEIKELKAKVESLAKEIVELKIVNGRFLLEITKAQQELETFKKEIQLRF